MTSVPESVTESGTDSSTDSSAERSHQGIAQWAQHGVQEYEEREATERAEKGEAQDDSPGR